MSYIYHETILVGKVTQCKRQSMIARENVQRRMAAANFPIGMMDYVVFQLAEPTKRNALHFIAEKFLEDQEYAQVYIHLHLIRLTPPQKFQYNQYRSSFI